MKMQATTLPADGPFVAPEAAPRPAELVSGEIDGPFASVAAVERSRELEHARRGTGVPVDRRRYAAWSDATIGPRVGDREIKRYIRVCFRKNSSSCSSPPATAHNAALCCKISRSTEPRCAASIGLSSPTSRARWQAAGRGASSPKRTHHGPAVPATTMRFPKIAISPRVPVWKRSSSVSASRDRAFASAEKASAFGTLARAGKIPRRARFTSSSRPIRRRIR